MATFVDLAELSTKQDNTKELDGKFADPVRIFGNLPDLPVEVVPANNGGDRGPAYRVLAGGMEIGALWMSREGSRSYASGKVGGAFAALRGLLGAKLLLNSPTEQRPWSLVMVVEENGNGTERPEGNSNGDFGTASNPFAGQETL